MFKAGIALCVMLTLFAAEVSAGGEVIQFYSFSEPPYLIIEDDPILGKTVKGLTFETVTCAAAAAGARAKVDVVPQPRALLYLAKGEIDGYFAVDPSTTLDRVAIPTDPISLEKWHIVTRTDEPEPANPRLGAVSGSNEEAWLRSQGRQIYLAVRSPEQLIELLHRRRIDQVLMDNRVLQSLPGTEGLASRFVKYVPLYAYMSRRFVEKNPDFIRAFNRMIPNCIDHNFDLDPLETVQIRELAYDLLNELESKISMVDAIRNGINIRNLSEILNLDNQWRALSPTSHSALAKQVAASPTSSAFAAWTKEKRGLVTEIMLTNNLGTLVAMSRLTSDFWQGDEAKFEQHIRSDARDLYVSPIHYDASTSRFQVTVSLPILDEDRWLPAGVLIMGLDVEKALLSEDHLIYLHGALPTQ